MKGRGKWPAIPYLKDRGKCPAMPYLKGRGKCSAMPYLKDRGNCPVINDIKLELLIYRKIPKWNYILVACSICKINDILWKLIESVNQGHVTFVSNDTEVKKSFFGQTFYLRVTLVSVCVYFCSFRQTNTKWTKSLTITPPQVSM